MAQVTQSPRSKSVKAVEALVQPDLAYDALTEKYRHVRSIGRIVGTHGTEVNSIVRLARDSRFSGGGHDPSLHHLFFMTPNHRYAGWDLTNLGPRDLQLMRDQQTDAIKEAINYSETSEASQAQDESLSDCIRYGVVIAFNKHVLHPEAELSDSIGSLTELELTVPEAPSLTAIEGIYPVNLFAATSLHKALAELH